MLSCVTEGRMSSHGYFDTEHCFSVCVGCLLRQVRDKDVEKYCCTLAVH